MMRKHVCLKPVISDLRRHYLLSTESLTILESFDIGDIFKRQIANGKAAAEIFCFNLKMSTIFDGKEYAALYIRYRPQYPVEVHDRILKYLDPDSQPKKLLVDVGCGSGQNTRVWAPYFDRILGIDTSEAQLEEARKSITDQPNIDFRCASANDLSGFIVDGSVDLVTAATALHWFDVEKFCKECQRILRPGGVVAAFSYVHPHLDDHRANRVYCEFDKALLKYWTPDCIRLRDHYKQLFIIVQKVFPHSERVDSIKMPLKQSIKDFCGWLRTLPHYELYRKQNPDSRGPVDKLSKELEEIYDAQQDDKDIVTGHMDIFMILCKKV